VKIRKIHFFKFPQYAFCKVHLRQRGWCYGAATGRKKIADVQICGCCTR